MTALANSVDDRANDVSKAVVMAIVTDLAQTTPVDTSQAISNWVVSLGTKSGVRLEPHVPGSAGSSRDASIETTIRNALTVLAQKKPGQTVYISNNLPYIRRLNDGYSAQAPAGFVERAVLIGRLTTKRIRF